MKKDEIKKLIEESNGDTGLITVDKLAYFYEKLLQEIPTPGGSTPPPVGAVLDTFVRQNPATTYPNTTWTQITDGRVLIAGNSTSTGGNNTCTLTKDQMPKHNHPFFQTDDSGTHYKWPVGYHPIEWGTTGSGVLLDKDGFAPTMNEGGQAQGNMISAIDEEAVGSSQSHSIQQSYQTVYRYRRTA